MISHLPSFIGRAIVVLLILLAVGCFQIPSANAQQDPVRNVNPHLIADASSPRDTLRSFLDLSREMIVTWRRSGTDDRVYVLLKGLVDVMDFSATANSAQPYEQVRRVMLLREILDRVELPPWSAIPGPGEVAQGTEAWTIPGTRLRIGRVGEGSRAGEYVFAAGTVEDLPLIYSRVRRLPYQPGAVPILEEFQSKAEDAFAVGSDQLEDRLSRIDTSSPRTVLTRFLFHMNLAYRIATDAEARVSASPPTMSIKDAQAAEGIAKSHIGRASTAFDLSRVPASQREDVRFEASLALKEVLDRVVLPQIRSIPDLRAVQRAGDETAPFVWRFPGLPITIARILEGDRAGAFTFDPRTLETLYNTYNRLKTLPYRERLALRSEWEYSGTDDLSPGLYELYTTTPGSLVPSVSFLGRIVQQLPAWTKTVRGGQTTWQWFGLTLASFLALAAGILVHIAVSRTARRRSGPAAGWILILSPAATIAVFVLLRWIVDEELNVTGAALEWFVNADRIVLLALSAWLIWSFFSAIAASAAASRRMPERGIDASLVRILCGIAAIVSTVAVVVAGLRDLGVDAVPLIAGLGVGGLAVALAVRPTLENLIGGLILHSDRPVRIGDFCSIGGQTGTIENIGVRSTQIRALDRTLISIPNARLADMDIVNWAHCDRMLVTAVLGLRYETTPDQLRHLLAKIRQMLHAHPKIDRNTVRVRYAGPGASSRDINVRIYVLTRDWNEFHAVREDVFLRIDDLVQDSGVGYAFPSQTLYLTRDQMPDAEAGAAAEAEVAAWRAANEMPYPRLSEKTMDELEGTLDYPPRGSNRSVHGQEVVAPEPEPLSAEEHDFEPRGSSKAP